MPTIAIVDDEETIRESVSFALRREGWQVETYADGEEAWPAFQKKMPDLIVLDILMPRMDGLELCRRVRTTSSAVPIIFLTSRDEEIDRIVGLELGADDYLGKPFSVRELIARIRVLFRRAALGASRQPDEPAPLRSGHLELDLQRYTAKWRSTSLSLTVTEFMMLLALARHPGHVKTRAQLTSEGYPHDTYVSDRTIDSHIKRIRRKLEESDPSFDAIETVYGLGYRWREM